MKSYHLNKGAGLAGLTLREHAEPKPGAREILVRVRAVSLNARELMIMIQGVYPLPVKPDVVAVSDGAGEVVGLGQGTTRFKIGDRVVASIFPRWIDGPFRLDHAAQLGGSMDGMLSEYVVLDEEAILLIPGHLSFEEAATLPCAAVTAWNALTGGAGLSAGQTVLTLGSGGVSLFALQLARAAGARVIATTSSAQKAARLRELGADAVIDYRVHSNWADEVRRLTGGNGVDRIVEVGGAGTLAQSVQAAAVGGEIALVGTLAEGAPAIDINPLRRAVASMRGIAVGSRAQFEAMNRAIGVNHIKPVIDRVFSFGETRTAFEYFAARKNFGKVVLAL